MPIHSAQTPSGKKGVQWGNKGKVYTGPNAKEKARKQAAAAFANGYKGKGR